MLTSLRRESLAQSNDGQEDRRRRGPDSEPKWFRDCSSRTAETQFEEVLILHSKNDRAALDKKSRLALIAAATERHEDTYFKALSLGTPDSEAKLDDCYNINKTIENVAERHCTYDMHDVFSIVVPMDDGKQLKKDEVYNLYTDYALVTLKMVAASNTWYNTWPQGPTWRENLAWTDRFFKNNVSPELGEKVNEVYTTFPKQARGGPLFFAIMMQQIMSQTEEAVIALQLRLKEDGPQEYSGFNDFFKHLEQQRKIEKALATSKIEEKLTPAGIFRAATSQYRSLWEEGLWTGTTRTADSIFTTAASKGRCWNCGEAGHQLPNCKLSKDPDRIQANKKAQLKALKKANSGSTKTTSKSGPDDNKKGQDSTVIDSGASVSITPNINDFVNGIHPTQLSDLKGLEGATKVHGQGIVEWTVFDLMDVVRTIRTTAYYVPSATIRLFSPQSYFQESNSGSYLMDAHTTRLTLRDGTQLIFPYNHGMNIPLMLPAVGRQKEVVNLSYQDMKVFSDQEHGLAYMSVADESNQNLTRAQMELLQWHWRLGHCNFQWIQSLAATPRKNIIDEEGKCEIPPLLPTKEKGVSSVPVPLCAACQLAKQSRRGTATSTEIKIEERDSILKAEKLEPGDRVSIDQFVSTIRGRLSHTKGKEKADEKFKKNLTSILRTAALSVVYRQSTHTVGPMPWYTARLHDHRSYSRLVTDLSAGPVLP
ncbi:hypothetical protein MHU86_16415 [Fragilaria crotonensis]|nr:hypothetical protein MHU86_16415 [Fragilaria crotonensis]